MPAVAALVPAIKALAAGAGRQAAMGAAKNIAKDKAKDFIKGKAKDKLTGKGRKKKKGKGRGREGALTTTGEDEGSEEGGSAIVPVTPMVGSYRVETPPQKPEEVGKPSKVSYETINNQLDSIIGLTNALKKTSAAKLKTDENRRKAERKAAEKAKKRQRENMLEGAGGAALGMAGNLYGKATQGFDPLKFFTMIFFGSLLKWVTTHGSKIIALLKGTLALFNNAGKLLRAGLGFLGKTIKGAFGLLGKVASPIIKLGKGIGSALKGVGRRLGGAFGKLGNSVKNFAKGILNKLKAAGKILTAPIRALQGLTGAEKKAVQTNKGLSKLVKESGTRATQNLGTAARPPGTISNATKSMRLKHGDEAARMYQGLVDNGMKPSKAAQYVNKSIASGKLTSAPLEGSLAGGKKGSQLFKGGLGKSTDRVITKIGGKNALKASKALKNALGRIPVVGGLITLVVSLLGGDPVTQALFKAGGAVLGGFLGSFIPIPVVGTLMGELIGEYVGDLMYVATMGEGVEAVGQKLKDDIAGVLSAGKAAMDWVGNGFGRLYEGIPKINVPFVGKFPNPVWMANPFNLIEKIGIFHKAFFTNDPMEKGEETTNGENKSEETSTPVSAETQQTLDTALPSSVDTNMSLGSQLKKNFGYKTGQEVKFKYGGSEYVARKTNQGWQFFDQKGLFGNYRRVDTKGKNQQMVAAFIKSVDTSVTSDTTERPPSSPKKMMTETEFYNATVEDSSLPGTYQEYKSNFEASSPQSTTSSGGGGVYGSEHIRSYAMKHGITDPTELAMFMAQMSHESGSFRHDTEIASGEKYETGTATGKVLGNTQPGDGPRFKGRGYIQLTGRWNYEHFGKKVGVDLIANPELAADPDVAAAIAVQFYKDRVDRSAAKRGDVAGATKGINPGLNGLKDRQRRFDIYMSGGTPEGDVKGSSSSPQVDSQPQTANVQPQTSKVDLPKTYTVAGVTYDADTGLPVSGTETQTTRAATPDNSDKMASQDQSDSDTSSTPAPAQVSASPQVQTQMSSGISGISQQLPYEQSGSTVVMMQGSGGQQMPMGGRGGRGTPVMMGSGDVVNSYYKSQLMGSLYKQG